MASRGDGSGSGDRGADGSSASCAQGIRASVRSSFSLTIRHATLDDKAELIELIARSARELSAGDYTPEQVEGALRGAFGVDTQLIMDRTYFVAEAAGKLVACGGWSKRRTLFGSDARSGRDAAELDPKVDAAKIRAFFVDPAYARRGIGSAILERCEAEARACGFRRYEMMATLPGARLYARHGYTGTDRIHYEVQPGVTIEFIPMTKNDAGHADRA
jgi:GNAT superfamily N-acetyltransferase